MGPPVEREVVRAMMLLRARTLAIGYSGARPVDRADDPRDAQRRLTPVVPEHGSLGASGDLAPLAHCALDADRRGDPTTADGERSGRPTRSRAAGSSPSALAAKEGLALINGTDGSLGML